MSKHAIIYLPLIGEDAVEWAESDSEGHLTTEVLSGTLADAQDAVDGMRVTLIVPADDVLLAKTVVPGNSLARAQQAVPYALEEQVADDVDSLHFALGTKNKDDEYPIAVISHHAMETILKQCLEAQIRPSEIVPETLALPELQSDTPEMTVWSGLLDHGRAVIRLGDQLGFATDMGMAALMIEGANAQRDNELPLSLVLFSTSPAEQITVPEMIEHETRSCDHRMALYATGLANAPRINLLQGDYNPKVGFDKAWKPWRTSLALAACVCVALFVGKWLDVRQLQQQEADIDAQIAAAFEQALPGARMQRPRTQIQSALDNIGAINSDGFTQRLSQIANSLATQPQTELRSIGYRNGRFDLDLSTDAVPTLDALGVELRRQGTLQLSVQSANRENNAVRGRVRIE
ncbi:MAG: type II secretion system protein GspL [Granulosicoccus sp.]